MHFFYILIIFFLGFTGDVLSQDINKKSIDNPVSEVLSSYYNEFDRTPTIPEDCKIDPEVFSIDGSLASYYSEFME